MKKVLFGFLAAAMLGSAAPASAASIMYVNFVGQDRTGATVSRLGTVDVTTGFVTEVGVLNTPADYMTDIAFDPFGNLWGISYESIWRINKDDATTTLVGTHDIPGLYGNALVFGSNNTLYAADGITSDLYTIDQSNGNSSSLGSTGFVSGGDLAFLNGSLYLAATLPANPPPGTQESLVRIDLSNLASSTEIGPFGVAAMYGLANGGGTLYGVAQTSFYIVDPLTGVASNPIAFSGAALGNAFGQAFYEEAAAPVPEPGSLLLLGGGLAAAIRRKRQKKS